MLHINNIASLVDDVIMIAYRIASLQAWYN